MPSSYLTNDGAIDPGERQVRRSILGVMAEHLNAATTGVSWSRYRFDFEGVRFDTVYFFSPVFEQFVSFQDAEFVGDCTFHALRLLKGGTFERCSVQGLLNLVSFELGETSANFANLRIPEGGHLSLAAPKTPQISSLLFTNHSLDSHIYGELSIWLPPTFEALGHIDFAEMRVLEGGRLKLSLGDGPGVADMTISDTSKWPKMRVVDSLFGSGSRLDVHQALYDSGVLLWERNRVSDGVLTTSIVP